MTKRDRHLSEKRLPSGDILVQGLTHREQMDALLKELLEEREDDDGNESEADVPPQGA